MTRVRKTNFVRGDYSFRYKEWSGLPHFEVYLKGERKRSWGNPLADMIMSTDGSCWVVSVKGWHDARRSFDEAVDLVIEWRDQISEQYRSKVERDAARTL
jgi:hypothetical protein